jgi:hypothetical protein
MNYTPLGGWFDIVKAVFTPPAVSIGLTASKVVAQGIVNTTKGDWSGQPPNLGPMKTNMPQTTAPTVPQGQAWENYIMTGNAGTKPMVDNILPKYNISSSTAILKPLTSYNVSSLNLSSLFSTPTTPEPQKPDSLKKYLPYVIIGGVGLVTMFALKG